MLSKTNEIEEEALRLAPHERARLAERLINSLDEEEEREIEKLWLKEAERRYSAYQKGDIDARPAELVFKEVRSRLK